MTNIEVVMEIGIGIAVVTILAGLLLMVSSRSVPIVPWNTLKVGEEYVVVATENLLARNFARVRDSQGQILFITLPDCYREIVVGDKVIVCIRLDHTLYLKICDDKAPLI